jgi:MYXO-CTERM domain-containing protein
MQMVGNRGNDVITAALLGNTPNPFNPSTTIHFTLPGAQEFRLEVFDITQSRRAEFDIFPDALVDDEFFASVWLYLPENWSLNVPGIDWNWYELANPFSSGGAPYSAIHIVQPDIDEAVFDLSIDFRDDSGVMRVLDRVDDFPLPRGRWLNVAWYVYRSATDGQQRVWLDGVLVSYQRGFNTINPDSDSFYTIIAKIYHETGDTVPHQLWVDDLELYEGLPVICDPVTDGDADADADGDGDADTDADGDGDGDGDGDTDADGDGDGDGDVDGDGDADGDGNANTDEGCSCRVTTRPSAPVWFLFVAALIALRTARRASR